MDESFDPLKCNEDLPSSPGCHMDYGKILETNKTSFFLFSFFLTAWWITSHRPSFRWHARLTGGGGGPEVAGSVSGGSRSVSPGVQPLPKHQLARWTCRHRHKSRESPAENCPPQEVCADGHWHVQGNESGQFWKSFIVWHELCTHVKHTHNYHSICGVSDYIYLFNYDTFHDVFIKRMY